MLMGWSAPGKRSSSAVLGLKAMRTTGTLASPRRLSPRKAMHGQNLKSPSYDTHIIIGSSPVPMGAFHDTFIQSALFLCLPFGFENVERILLDVTACSCKQARG